MKGTVRWQRVLVAVAIVHAVVVSGAMAAYSNGPNGHYGRPDVDLPVTGGSSLLPLSSVAIWMIVLGVGLAVAGRRQRAREAAEPVAD